MKREYETERLILRVLDKSDAELVMDYYLRNKKFLEEWDAVRPEEFYTRGFHEKHLEQDTLRMENKNTLRFWIFKKEERNRIIGTVCFDNIVWGVFLSCFLGYKLDGEEINKGYMTEAVQKGIEIVFGDLGLHRIEANIMPKNEPSLRVTKKLGFYEEGIARQYLKINGKWEDHIHMVLLNDKV